MNRAAHDAGQAIIMVIGLSVLLMTVGVMLVQQTIQTDPLLQSNSIQHAAYRGLQAGMNSYQSIVNTNPNLANCNTSTNGNALCQGARYQKWNLVSNTNGANGTIPEWYLFDNPQPVFNTDGSLASLQVQIVGVAGFLNHYAYQSSIANLAPVNGFLTTLWWSDFEASDTNVNNPSYTGSSPVCKYNYKNGYGGPGSNCNAVYFGPSDTINGPIFANDSIYVSGGPDFGTSLNPAAVKTGDPLCLFVNGSDSNCLTGFGNYAPVPPSAIKQPPQLPPSDDTSLGLVAAVAAPNNGCVYYGPTTITLAGSTMTVTSPDTVGTTQSFIASGCPLNGSGALPPNGVIYVDDAAPGSGDGISKTVPGVNPFDDTAHGGRYKQTCGNYTDNGSTMPCYFGWTSTGGQDSEGDAFVSGNLAASSSVAGDLTIGTSNDIIIDGNLTYTDCSTPNEWVNPITQVVGTGTPHESRCNYRTDGKNDALGLIANHYVEVDHPIDPQSSNHDTLLPTCGSNAANAVTPHLIAPLCQPVDSSNNITIDAAILALTQSFGINNYASGNQMGNCQSSGTGCIILYGSLQQEARGAVGIIGNSGFGKYYTWDPRLELVAPPSYLNPGTASYNLNSSAISSSLGCPPLHPVYGSGLGPPPCLQVPALPIGTPTDVVTNTPTSPVHSQSVTFTATITAPSGRPTPTGALTWTLTGPVTSCTSTTGPTGSSNVATYTCVITTTSSYPVTYSATATYPGDGNYYSTGSNTDTFSVSS
jgi:hypothetical protein